MSMQPHPSQSSLSPPPSRNKRTSCPTSILIADDDSKFRLGVESLFELCNFAKTQKFLVVGQAASVEQALGLAKEQSPGVVLLDLELGQDCGLQFLQRHIQGNNRSRVLVVSDRQDDEQVFRAMQAGARGYLLKQQVPTHLLEAIATILRDEIYLSPQLATAFFRGFHFYSGRSLQSKPCIHLTEREQEVLHWVVQGASNIQISQELCITVGTVKAYLTTIFEKLEVKSRTQAALKALKLGLVYA